MADDFEVTYYLDGKYGGGNEPYQFTIPADDFDGMNYSAGTLSALFWQRIQKDFRDNVRPVCPQEAEFIAWAKARQAEMKAKASQ